MFFIMVSENKKPAGPMPAGSVVRRCVSLAPFVQPLFAPLVEPVEILTMPENGAREGESKSLPRGEGFREGVTFTR